VASCALVDSYGVASCTGSPFFEPPSASRAACRGCVAASEPEIGSPFAHSASLARADAARASLAAGCTRRRYCHHGAFAERGAQSLRTVPRLIYATSWHASVPRAHAAPPRFARVAQADIQMMLAAQCHLGTKCAPVPCFLAQP